MKILVKEENGIISTCINTSMICFERHYGGIVFQYPNGTLHLVFSFYKKDHPVVQEMFSKILQIFYRVPINSELTITDSHDKMHSSDALVFYSGFYEFLMKYATKEEMDEIDALILKANMIGDKE